MQVQNKSNFANDDNNVKIVIELIDNLLIKRINSG